MIRARHRRAIRKRGQTGNGLALAHDDVHFEFPFRSTSTNNIVHGSTLSVQIFTTATEFNRVVVDRRVVVDETDKLTRCPGVRTVVDVVETIRHVRREVLLQICQCWCPRETCIMSRQDVIYNGHVDELERTHHVAIRGPVVSKHIRQGIQ